MENVSSLIIATAITTRSLQVKPDTPHTPTHRTHRTHTLHYSSNIFTSMQLNTNNREADSLDDDCCVVTREGALHRWRRHRSQCSNDVVRSTEPNLTLKNRGKRTAHTTKKAGLYVLLETPCAPFEILTVLMTATEKQHTSAAPSHNSELPRDNPFPFHRYAGQQCLPCKLWHNLITGNSNLLTYQMFKLAAHSERIPVMVRLVPLVTLGRYQGQSVHHTGLL
jgi:hypothetical protein